ncbi:hypothetical protein QZH41_014845 [Actinostola sp. cb2023]|nr:hypothetical protein QZH41_014845 [Actinostola sp. cb2023]
MASRGKSPKTPKSKSPRKRDSSDNSLSPRESPRTRATCDVSRRVRDLCAKWHELVEKWSNLNTLGINVANNVMNLQLQKQYSDVDNSNSLTVLSDLSTTSSELEENVMKLLEELTQILSKMSQVCNKMESISESFLAAQKLKNFNEKEVNDHETEIYFNTWPLHQYYSISQKLYSMYGKELTLKQKLCSHFTRTKDRNELFVYLSLWLHEPYLNDEKDVLLESMLIETGLR